MSVKTRCEVEILEVDGKDLDRNAKPKPVLVVESDWRPGTTYVTVAVGGTKYTVLASAMKVAVENASNR